MLNENNNKEEKLYIEDIEPKLFMEDTSLKLYSFKFINYFIDNYCSIPLSNNGVEKIDKLINDYINKNNGIDLIDFKNVKRYFIAILNYFYYSNMCLTCSKDVILTYIFSSKIMAKFQEKLSIEDEKLFDEVLQYIRNYNVKIPCKDFEPVKMHLPNSWYITPYNHLYNTMGKDGHKQANLIYPLYYSIIRNDNISNPVKIYEYLKETLERGWINKSDFDKYTNSIYDFMAIYPDYYYTLNSFDEHQYRTISKRTYNPKIVGLITGIESAQAGLYSFFNYLKNNSSDYYNDLEYLKSLYLDDILIRCCGFHKISSICDKTITTSCINYEEQLAEYINKGWRIDFVKPIVLDNYTKRIEEYPDEFLLIRNMH